MKEKNRKKLFLKKKTISFLSENQMDKVLGATGDECYSATCPGERGCDDTDADCSGPTDGVCPTDVGCPQPTDSACGTDNSSGCGTVIEPTAMCLSENGWCTYNLSCSW